MTITVPDDLKHFIARRGLFEGFTRGEVRAFDAAGAVYMLPLIGMEPEQAIKIANSFAEFSETFELEAE